MVAVTRFFPGNPLSTMVPAISMNELRVCALRAIKSYRIQKRTEFESQCCLHTYKLSDVCSTGTLSKNGAPQCGAVHDVGRSN